MGDPLAQERKLRFIFIAPCAREAFFNPVKKGMTDAADLMKVECTFTGTEDADLDEQINLVKQAITTGCDGIALSIVHPTAFNSVVEDAMKAGIAVVAFNVDTNDPENRRLSSVCQNLRNAGRILGSHAFEHIAPNSRVLMTVHSAGISALEDRLQGMREVLSAKKITTELIVTGIDAEGAAEKITTELRSQPEIKTVLSTGQADTEGAGLAIERNFAANGLYAAGFDLSTEILRLIRAKIIAFTIDQQPYVQGFYPVVQLTQYCRYGIRPSNIDAGAAMITSHEVEKVLKLTSQLYR